MVIPDKWQLYSLSDDSPPPPPPIIQAAKPGVMLQKQGQHQLEKGLALCEPDDTARIAWTYAEIGLIL